MMWVKRFFGDLIGAHVDGARVMLALPWLFGIVVLCEFAQHVVEIRTGFFVDAATREAVALDAGRMAFAWPKMALVYIGGFFAIRYLVLGDARLAMRPSAATVARYLPYVAYSLALFVLIFFAGSFLPKDQVMGFRSVVGLSQVAIEPLLMLWIVSAATDGPVSGPLRSARLTGWMYLWALPIFFIGRLPLNGAHQYFHHLALGKSAATVWTLMIIDALMVGLLVAAIPALYVRIARAIDERALRRARLAVA
ncbi:hypothetical protein TPR58_18240 [Sphingomonas sp. HF-S3]|uniref:Uncharacterized protein n=1 Tax=Sphingomonas rustica TaxID=3103142 RepID=A0ABV0BC55_9SPHN